MIAVARTEQVEKVLDMTENQNGTERVINVAEIEPKLRHTIIDQLFEHLDAGQSLQIVVDHDPKRLRFQLEARHGSTCDWSYLEEGPEVWRVRLRQARGDRPLG